MVQPMQFRDWKSHLRDFSFVLLCGACFVLQRYVKLLTNVDNKGANVLFWVCLKALKIVTAKYAKYNRCGMQIGKHIFSWTFVLLCFPHPLTFLSVFCHQYVIIKY